MIKLLKEAVARQKIECSQPGDRPVFDKLRELWRLIEDTQTCDDCWLKIREKHRTPY